MKSYLDCIPCFTRQALSALREVTDDEAQIERILQRALVEISSFDLGESPPELVQKMHRMIRNELGDVDPYKEIKKRSTETALGLLEEAQPVVDGALDPFKMGLRFSLAGNSMDFAVTSKWSNLNLKHFVDETRLHYLDYNDVEVFRSAVTKAKTILFLGDNAGETVFDRLFIEQFPESAITYAVRGSAVINDATLEDAIAAGLDRMATLIDNGNDAPGTLLDQCSPEFVEAFEQADVVIAKGQGNYESLNDASRPVFFLTQVKCPIIAMDIKEPEGSWVVKHHDGGAVS